MAMNAVRFTLFHNQKGYCHYCNVKMTTGLKGPYHVTADHIRTKKEGGGDTIGNLVGACFECNNRRGSIRYEAFKEFTTLYGREHYVSVYKRINHEEVEKHKLMWAFIRSERLDLAWLAPSSYFGDRTTWYSPPNSGLAKGPKGPVNLTSRPTVPLRRPFLQVCRNILKDIRLKFTYDQRKLIIDEGLAREERQLRDRTDRDASRGLHSSTVGDGPDDQTRRDRVTLGGVQGNANDWPMLDPVWHLPSPQS